MPLTEKIKEHLKRCEYAMQSAKPILGKPHFLIDNRNLTVIGFVSMLIEHQESLLVLVMHEKAGSAFALARPIVEGAYRGMWLNLPATDDEVKKFNEKDKIDLGFGEIATALDGAYGTGDFFQDLKTRSWKALNSYAHDGMLQIGRRLVSVVKQTGWCPQSAPILTRITDLLRMVSLSTVPFQDF
jgi:hypothetical protein